ncbi:MAG TPA: hypothetical protein PKK06_06120 [Phycisphaerae bacterium]|nr:hypothetical protein [Phycisphaerae bacterium]HNU44230.1 hypothetical protein [Phycisphaerae bacterium]
MAFRDILMVVLLSLGGLLLGASCRRRAPDLPVYDTADWGGAGQFVLRSSAPGSTDLLLRAFAVPEPVAAHRVTSAPSPDSVIYRYQPGAQRLETVRASAWTAATGEVCDCVAQEAQPIDPFGVDYQSDTLTFQGRAVTTAKPSLANVVPSPSGRYVAVVSGERTRRHSFSPVPFMGGGGCIEQHYHEVLKRSDGTRLGAAVALPLSSVNWGTMACWSCDERYVVYRDSAGIILCIVPTDVERGE